MSKRKFKLLAAFMIITFIITICFIAFEAGVYLKQKNISMTKETIETTKTVEDTFVEKEDNTKDALIEKEEIVPIKKEKPPITEEKDISIVFTGDVLFTDSLLELYGRNSSQITGMIEQDVVDELVSGDITMVNQEFPFSTGGTQMVDKQYTFRADPKYVEILRQMGVDIVSLANNHTLDFGIEALLDTITTLDNGKIKHVGAGENIDKAKKTEYIVINNTTIAFLGASRVIPVHSWNAAENNAGLFTTYDPALLLEEIEVAHANSDFVVVYVHWGIEKKEFPEEYQRNLAKQYIDAGADIIIGSHPHVLQGIEFYREKPIVYSMGNFVFGNSTFQTMLLKIKINKKDKIEIMLIPCETKNGYTSKITNTDKIKQFTNYIESISFQIKINEQGRVIQDDDF